MEFNADHDLATHSSGCEAIAMRLKLYRFYFRRMGSSTCSNALNNIHRNHFSIPSKILREKNAVENELAEKCILWPVAGDWWSTKTHFSKWLLVVWPGVAYGEIFGIFNRDMRRPAIGFCTEIAAMILHSFRIFRYFDSNQRTFSIHAKSSDDIHVGNYPNSPQHRFELAK